MEIKARLDKGWADVKFVSGQCRRKNTHQGLGDCLSTLGVSQIDTVIGCLKRKEIN